jgi:hypothetical protein
MPLQTQRFSRCITVMVCAGGVWELEGPQTNDMYRLDEGSGSEWYGAFPDCGPQAEDSAAKLKRSQLIVCTLHRCTCTVSVYSFPPAAKFFLPDWPAVSVSS